ncbi:RNA chaperone Hfq [Halonatronum saccharophilum]|uniref:RNA chaperone Hfq n=1 Tax=Halonatronum saccharophilum TaxID=150060 RepID=UPI00048254F7|nr:RNA chaperone Hfq [Halonatronum saccharophilum]
MKGQINLQDNFLNELRKREEEVKVFLVNGFCLSAVIEGFDSFVLVVREGERQQMIYKHAISTIVPQNLVDNLFEDN